MIPFMKTCCSSNGLCHIIATLLRLPLFTHLHTFTYTYRNTHTHTHPHKYKHTLHFLLLDILTDNGINENLYLLQITVGDPISLARRHQFMLLVEDVIQVYGSSLTFNPLILLRVL